MRKRTVAREIAVQVLYQLDLRGQEVLEELDALLEDASEDAEVRKFAHDLVVGTWEHRAQIDENITKVATNWDLPRMAAVDRNILRLATYEICYCPDIPPLVSINEAIEIAKKFSTKNSGPFVNGILDNVRMKCAPPGKQKK